MQTSEKSLTIALDIEDIATTRKGRKIVNAFMDAASTMFRTKRGRLALLAQLDRFEHIRRIHRFTLEDSLDGLKSIALETPDKTVAVQDAQ